MTSTVLLENIFRLSRSYGSMRYIIPPKNIWFVPAFFLRLLIYILTRLLYALRVSGREHLPNKGGCLLVSNHLSYLDVLFLQIASPRYLQYVAHEELFHTWWLGWFLRMLDVIPISSRNPRRAIRQVVEHLENGEMVCVFPEGQISRTGNLLKIRQGFALMARQAGVPVLPAVVDGVWGSLLSFSGNGYWWKKPLPFRHQVRVGFGAPLEPNEDLPHRVRLAFLDLQADLMPKRPELDVSLGHAAVRGLARRPWKLQLVDTFAERRLSRGKLLAAAIALSRRWKSRLKDERVALVLPPGAGGGLANLALVLAGRIPVNMNFTAGRSATESSYRRAGISTAVTAEAMKAKVGDFPWPETVIDLPAELKSLSKPALLGWLVLIWLLPGKALAALLGVPRGGGDREAALLFTSGSSGEPKGVVLTHRNLVGNITQISNTNFLLNNDSFLAALPLFHSFGFTVTWWFPILNGIPIVTAPSPLDVPAISKAAKSGQPTALFGTPGFLRPYVKKIPAENLDSIRLAVSGAEHLPEDLRKSFEDKFGAPVLEGYGLTETSPVVSVNLPAPKPAMNGERQVGHRDGSVGRLFPGLSARLVHQETGEPCAPGESGVLRLRGVNVFPGYLEDPEQNKKAFDDGWFVTGDLARFDQDGFLFIEGRVSRFSKIGGEMVPHGRVEEAVADALNLSGDGAEVVVMGVQDADGREHLVVLGTVEADPGELRKKLKEAGLPNLWIPKRHYQVDEIPVLGSGKLDLAACQKLADDKFAGDGGKNAESNGED